VRRCIPPTLGIKNACRDSKECVHRHRFKTRDEARFEIFRYIEGFYNPHRRHSSLGNLSPAEFERRLEQRRLQAAAS